VTNRREFSARPIRRRSDSSSAAAGGSRADPHLQAHDGFCLWPSRFTEHSVRNSPWRTGRGTSPPKSPTACRRRGLQFGVYLSPWIATRRTTAAPPMSRITEPVAGAAGSLRPIFEIWFDGANGGDGFYGGARETRSIDRRTYYGWDETWQIVRELQPDACLFSDAGPDVRWVGNERGEAGGRAGHTEPGRLRAGRG